MAILKHLSCIQFKNYTQAAYNFDKRITAIYGKNGAGKTNLLDAIYYLCFTKSYFSQSDAMLVQHGKQGFRLEGQFLQNDGENRVVTAILRETGKKEVAWNGEPYTKLSAHIGRLPAVVIAPDDVSIVTGSSELRRKLMDGLLCQLHPQYLQTLMEYNKILQQRNSLLKQMAETNQLDDTLLQVIDAQLSLKGGYIFVERQKGMQTFLQKALQHYIQIAGNVDQVTLTYQSFLGNKDSSVEDAADFFKQTLVVQRKKDRLLQRTTIGIHRDDIVFTMHEQPFKQIASQGQRKSLLFALKLTEFETLEQQKGFPPLLLLDDVFEKLDQQRMKNLLFEVCLEKNGQVFITDTHQQRLEGSLQEIGADFELLEVVGF